MRTTLSQVTVALFLALVAGVAVGDNPPPKPAHCQAGFHSECTPNPGPYGGWLCTCVGNRYSQKIKISLPEDPKANPLKASDKPGEKAKKKRQAKKGPPASVEPPADKKR